VSWRTASPFIIVGTAFAFVGLERLFPYDRDQRIFRKGFFVDLVGYGLFQSYLLGLAINAIIRGLASWAGAPDGLHLVTGWPVALQVFFFFLSHDFYIYWFHRWQHHSKYLFRIHEAHHSVPDVDWLAGTRSHSLEILINQTIEFAPIALLGAAPEVAIIKATLDAVWGMYIHSNVGARSGRLQLILNGPEMHRWHHARELADKNANFGTKLAIWDWIFGTAFLPATKPKGYGLAAGDRYPEGYVAQHIAAFRRFPPPDPQPVPDLALRTAGPEASQEPAR
jgi:sterol desaturase/sphingolipid hydroxylase (fatty acid hydroxylase superfamily)